MVAVTALAPIGPNVVKRTSGAAYVVASGVSGGTLTGSQIFGAVTALAAVGTLALALLAASRKQKRDAEADRRRLVADTEKRVGDPLRRRIDELERQLDHAQGVGDSWMKLYLAQLSGRVVPPEDDG